MCEAWVNEPGVIEIDGNGVVTTYQSGGTVYRARMSRATFRRFVEGAIRKLNDYEAAERDWRTVVPMRG